MVVVLVMMVMVVVVLMEVWVVRRIHVGLTEGHAVVVLVVVFSRVVVRWIWSSLVVTCNCGPYCGISGAGDAGVIARGLIVKGGTVVWGVVG